MGRASLLALALLAVALLAAGCGGGGESTTATVSAVEAAPKPPRAAEKIGFVPIGGGRYRLDDCVATALLTSHAAIEKQKQAGKQVIVTPTGSLGVEPAGGPRCVKVMEEAIAFVDVP